MYKKYVFFILLATGLSISSPTEANTSSSSAVSRAETEVFVRDYFSDIPVMIEIARCESNFRQFTDSGNVLRGGNGGGMVGVFQFFASIHDSVAEEFDWDIDTLEGNLAYARHVYETQGTTPWNSAKDCWNTSEVKTATAMNNSAEIAQLKQRLTLLIQLLELLQRLEKLSA